MSANARLLSVLALWLLVAAGIGSYMSFYVGGHGSIVYLLFTLPVAVSGAIGSTLSLKVNGLRTASPWLRFVVVALLAYAPILVLALYGILTDPNYRMRDAIAFAGMLAIPATVTAAVAEVVAHGTKRRRESAA